MARGDIIRWRTVRPTGRLAAVGCLALVLASGVYAQNEAQVRWLPEALGRARGPAIMAVPA